MVVTDHKGKQRKRYPSASMMMPYEKLKSLSSVQPYLKPGITFRQRDEIAYAISDNEAAAQLNEARRQLLNTITGQVKPAA